MLPYLQNSIANNDKVSPIFSVLCTPKLNHSNSTIDSIFIKTVSLILRTRSLLASEATVDKLYCLKLDAEQLNEEYNSWPQTLSEEWGPKSVGVIAPRNVETTWVYFYSFDAHIPITVLRA